VDADQDYLEHAELLSQACASLRGRHPDRLAPGPVARTRGPGDVGPATFGTGPDHTEDLGDRDAAST
jgi:hypothetical protein